MTSQLPINPPWPVDTIHGSGFALVHIDYGTLENGCLLVANKETGALRYYRATDVKMAENYTYGIVKNL